MFSEIRELMDAVSRSPDIIHLFCDVSPGGEIANPNGTPVVGTELLDRCCEFNVKLLWIASDNESGGYIAGFKARGKRMNLVMTLKRNDPKFSRFLDQILFRMFYETLCQLHGWTYPLKYQVPRIRTCRPQFFTLDAAV